MTKLNQIIAIEKGVKALAAREVTDIHHQVQRAPQLTGISRTYRPHAEDGTVLPPESTRVQVRADQEIDRAARILTRLFDVVATKDWANCTARADVVVDKHTVLTDVPVSYLLFLDKQLADLHTFLKKLPILDPAEKWEWDDTADCWRSTPAQTIRTKKVPRNHVVSAATDKHPEQVQVYTEDIPDGIWTTIKFSGAMPAHRVNELVARVEQLTQAVKQAREEANLAEVADQHVGASVFTWLLRTQ